MARFATGQSLSELEVVQNPALGAYSIWQFGLGFQSESGDPAKLPVLFLVLPLLLHQPTLAVISSTKEIGADLVCSQTRRGSRKSAGYS